MLLEFTWAYYSFIVRPYLLLVFTQDVDTMAVDLSQHMVRVEPAGQFLDVAYASGFTDPQNFRGRLLQFMR